MDYQVPQFIEVEDKIFGPLTLKQFIYLAGGAGLCIVFLLYLPFILGILLSIPVAGLAIALAFYKVNGKNFVEIMEYGFNFLLSRRLYLWKKEGQAAAPPPRAPEAPAATPAAGQKPLTRRKLEELAFALDVRTNNDQTIT